MTTREMLLTLSIIVAAIIYVAAAFGTHYLSKRLTPYFTPDISHDDFYDFSALMFYWWVYLPVILILSGIALLCKQAVLHSIPVKMLTLAGNSTVSYPYRDSLPASLVQPPQTLLVPRLNAILGGLTFRLTERRKRLAKASNNG